MTIDDEIQKAVRIGERNRDVIELARNWCAHLEIVHWGGTGLVEIESGLPIGARYFKCQHAKGNIVAGMNLEWIALDFYDQNCANCSQRLPVRLPNLSELVANRDRARQRELDAETCATQLKAKALEFRVNRRSELSKGSDPKQKSLIDSLDDFDRDPIDLNLQVLMETAIAASGYFDATIREILYEIAEAGDLARAEGALKVLDSLSSDGSRLCKIALNVLAQHGVSAVAADLVANNLTTDHEGLVPAALPSLFAMALPCHGFLGSLPSEGNPRPLLAAFQVFPRLVLAAAQEHLRSPDKELRIRACNAVSEIMKVDHSFGLEVLEDLIGSLSLPDDHYGEHGSAEYHVASSLAYLMTSYPDRVDARIQLESQNAEESLRSALVRVYELVLQEDRSARSDQTGRASELAFQRYVDLVAHRVENERLLKAIWFFRDRALAFPQLFEKHSETLLGCAALIAGDLETPDSPLLDLSIAPNPLRGLETASRRQMLWSMLDAVLKALGELACQKPESVGKLLLASFDAVDERHEHFKAGLVEAIGHMASAPAGAVFVVPVLYHAMTSRSSLVRSAGAQAYGRASGLDPDGLPALVHETFLLLLQDPFVIVHRASISALEEVDLPPRFAPQAIRCMVALVNAYSRSHSDDDLLCKCLECLIRLLKRSGGQIDIKTRASIVEIISKMRATYAARFVVYQKRIVQGTPGLGRLLIRLLNDEESREHFIDELVDMLGDIPTTEIPELAEDFLSTAKTRELLDMPITDELLEILTGAGVWTAASSIASDSVARLSDSTWDRARKLYGEARRIAANLELAAAEENVQSIFELTEKWNAIAQDMKRND